MTEAALLTRIERLQAREPRLTPVGAGVLLAVRDGAASDSRSFARDFGLAHALVIREVVALEAELGLIGITRTDPRTQRLFYTLTGAGAALADEKEKADETGSPKR